MESNPQLIEKQLNEQFFRGNKLRLFIGIVQAVFMVAINLAIAWVTQQIVDIISGKGASLSLTENIYATVGILAAIAATMAINYFSVPGFIAKAMTQYKDYAYQVLSKKSISAFNSENTSLYISALSNDANVIETDYLAKIFNLLVNIMLFCGAFVMMIFYSPTLTLATVILLLLPIGASIASGNRLAKAEEQVSNQNESMLAALKDSLTGFSVIKSFKSEARMCEIIKADILKTEGVKCRKRKISLIVQALAISAGYITQLGIFIVGAWLVVSGKNITPGTVLAFTQLMNYITGPISEVPQMLAKKKAAHALIRKLAGALSDNVRDERKDIDITLKYGITLENVSFSYDGEKEAIKEVNCCFHKGKSYAVVGGSGSGKSTILNLLMGGRNDFTGRILYDDDEIRQISGQSLYDLVPLVQQNVFVFNSSIRENITMFNDFGENEVDKAIEMSGLSKFIEERGSDYMCGENGSGLSGGEKQRISIARSLLRHTQVLLVDEATSALDSETASHVTGSILNLKDITRIIVTHRLEESQLRKYDSIIAVKNGKIEEDGTFDELMKRKGYFYSLYNVSQ